MGLAQRPQHSIPKRGQREGPAASKRFRVILFIECCFCCSSSLPLNYGRRRQRRRRRSRQLLSRAACGFSLNAFQIMCVCCCCFRMSSPPTPSCPSPEPPPSVTTHSALKHDQPEVTQCSKNTTSHKMELPTQPPTQTL